jgi:hypothetical protein
MRTHQVLAWRKAEGVPNHAGRGPSRESNTINKKNSEMQVIESPHGSTRKEVPTPAEEENGYLSDSKQADVQVVLLFEL